MRLNNADDVRVALTGPCYEIFCSAGVRERYAVERAPNVCWNSMINDSAAKFVTCEVSRPRMFVIFGTGSWIIWCNALPELRRAGIVEGFDRLRFGK